MRFILTASLLVLCASVCRNGFGQPVPAGMTKHFEFHSDPWINLHHFLYQWSREGLPVEDRMRVAVPERTSLTELSSDDRRMWSRAVDFYRDAVAARSHWDLEMLRLKRELLLLGGDPAASPPDRIKGISSALSSAMGVYQKRWWRQHDSANRTWIASVVPRLRTHEARFVETTRKISDAKWPEERWRVDVSAYANGRAAYTTSEGHIVIYSTDPFIQDLYALETVLHEVQHAEAVGGTLADDLDRAFKSAGGTPPPNLSHGLIFATAGAFTQTVAEYEGLPPHTPYWIRAGLDQVDGWKELIPTVDELWPPVVRGKRSKDETLAALAGRGQR